MQNRIVDIYVDAAERYLEEGKAESKNVYEFEQSDSYQHAQLLILGSIAASLIALARK